jgi:DNA polymerase-1
MVKVYGIDTADFTHAESAEEIMWEVSKTGWVQLDSETTGFDPHLKDLMCLQLGNRENQYVIHPSKVHEFKGFLETHSLIGHNIKFDLKFLYKYGIYPRRVYDTMLAEQVLYCGHKKMRHNLAAVVKRRLNKDRDKSIRDNIWREGLTTRVIQYAADDVVDLEDLKDLQQTDLEKWELTRALEIENQFVLCLAYIEFCGFKLDREKWKRKMEKDYAAYRAAEKALDQWVLDHEASHGLQKFISPQLDLFSTEQKVKVLWTSPKQVIRLFNALGMKTRVVVKGVEKDSVDAKHIEHYRKDYELVDKYLTYKELQKLVSTYGQNFIDQINPITGRLHTTFRQILNTNRLSSGGKNKATGEEYLNFQNIPSDKETRACFVSQEGNTLLVSDYSGQEQIVLANFSLDENLLQFYDEGLSDMHSFVASKMHPELEGLTLDQIKNEHKDKRQKAKSAGFAINYGGNGTTIAENLGVSQEEGDAVYNGYFEAFPGLKQYFDAQKKIGLDLGYILFNPITKRKSFIEDYDQFLALRKQLTRQFWDKWKRVKTFPKTHPEYIRMKETMSKYFKIKGAIERSTLNYPIQGTSAEITKISCIYFYRWILNNHLQGTVLFCNTIHDENVVECPVEMAEETSFQLQEAMVQAGRIYCKRVPLKAEPEQTLYWKK